MAVRIPIPCDTYAVAVNGEKPQNPNAQAEIRNIPFGQGRGLGELGYNGFCNQYGVEFGLERDGVIR